MLDYQEMPVALFALMIPGVGFLMFFLSIFTDAFKNTSVNGMPTTNRYFSLMFGLFFGLLLGIVPFVFLVLPAVCDNTRNRNNVGVFDGVTRLVIGRRVACCEARSKRSNLMNIKRLSCNVNNPG